MKALLMTALLATTPSADEVHPEPDALLVEIGVVTAVLGLALTAGSLAGALGVTTELNEGVYDNDAEFQSGQTLGLALLVTAGVGLLVTGAGVGVALVGDE